MASESKQDDAGVERAAEELYAGPLETFVEQRTRLAGELRKAGDRAGAATVAKLPRPTLSAWVVNQLARHERAAVRTLAEASARLRQAQVGSVAGEGGAGRREAFAAASAAHREALAALRAASERILAEAGHPAAPAMHERIARNLRAMVAGDEAAKQIESGRLVRDVGSEGLADLAALAASLPASASAAAGARRAPAAGATPAEARAEARREARERAAHEKELARLRQALAEVEKRAHQARGRAERARAAAKEADAEAAAAESEATTARRALAEAEARSRA
jgi:hypothetical protein